MTCSASLVGRPEHAGPVPAAGIVPGSGAALARPVMVLA